MKPHIRFRFLISFIVIMITGNLKINAQAAGDDCSTATLLTVGSSCITQTFSSVGATASGGVANPTCGFYQGGDVWFAAVVPASGHIRVEVTSIAPFDAKFAIYTGSCGSLTQHSCISSPLKKTISDAALAGQTIYFRVFNRNSATGGSFTICVWEPIVPSNNDCANAIPLTVGTSCSMTTYTNAYATSQSTTVSPNPTCGFYSGGDVWFTAVMPASGKLRVETTDSPGMSTTTAVYSGTCGAMTQLFCIDDNEHTYVNTSLAGQPLYIRIYNWANEDGGSFGICVWEPPVPVNDDCANAIPLTIGSGCTISAYTNAYATEQAAAIAPTPTCGFYSGGDVWFSAQMPASGKFRVETTDSQGMSASTAVYSGTCGAMTQIFCTDDNEHTYVNTALAGQLLLIRIYNRATEEGGSFGICVWEPSVPVNDDCNNALSLTVSSACTISSFSNAYSTGQAASVAPNPSCGFYIGGDVWFVVVMPSSGNLRIETTNTPGMLTQVAAYSGSCGSFTQLLCMQLDNNRTYHNSSLAGQSIYIRVFNYNNEEGGPFGLCVWEPLVPVNDDCSNATPLTVGSSCVFINATNAYSTSQPTTVAANPTCGFYAGGDVWYKFLMPLTGILTVQWNNISAMNAKVALYSGTCGAFTQIACVSSGTTLPFNNSSFAGQTLYLRIWNQGNEDGGTFSLCAYDGSCSVTVSNVTTTNAACNISNNGTITVTATCANCSGNLQYSVNNGFTYQSSSTFNGLSSTGTYNIRVRDATAVNCASSWTGNPVTVGSDNAAIITYYGDADGDTYGSASVSQASCTGIPTGYVVDSNDCDDACAIINPSEIEICNGMDDNCNGQMDENLNCFACKVFIEGYMASNNSMRNVLHDVTGNPYVTACDSIILTLIDPVNLNVAIISETTLLFTNGISYLAIPPSIAGASYYVAIRHRNAIETWSKQPVMISTNTQFDFTSPQ